MLALIITPDGVINKREIDGYRGLKKALNGGYLEGLTFTKEVFAYLDEDGKAKDLPYNTLGTFLAKRLRIGLHPHDYIVGNLILVGSPDEEGNETDIPETFVTQLQEMGMDIQ